MLGHQYLEDLWLIAIDDLDDHSICENVDTTLCLAATFADIIDAQQLSFEQGMELTDEHLPEAYDLFQQVLASYASVAGIWSQGVWDVTPYNYFFALEPVAYDDFASVVAARFFPSVACIKLIKIRLKKIIMPCLKKIIITNSWLKASAPKCSQLYPCSLRLTSPKTTVRQNRKNYFFGQ